MAHKIVNLETSTFCMDCLQSWPTDIDPNHFDCDRFGMMCWADPRSRYSDGIGHDWVRNQSFAECADCDAHVAGV